MIHYLADSCKYNGIELMPHGVGVPFPGWTRGLAEHTLVELERLWAADYTHVLYTDAIDVLFVASLPEIEWKYRNLGSPPCVMSADSDIPRFNTDAFLAAPEPWRYINAGCFMGQTRFLADYIAKLKAKYLLVDGDPQNWFIREWPIGGFILDFSCTIFQSWDGNPAVRIIGGRVLNCVHGTYPCVLHFRGGYSDPRTGRDERMRPVVEEIYGKDGLECR